MTPSKSENADSSPSSSFHDNSENNLQPYFVLHKGSASARPKSRRKLNDEYDDDNSLFNLRINAFHSLWSSIDTTVKDILRQINRSIFDDVNSWVHSSFKKVRSCGKPGFAEATQPYPLPINTLSKQIYTALVYTKNMEFVDDQLTFEELGNHLKSSGCHVANMSSLDFSAKNGIGGCLTRLLRKYLMVTLDDADLSILASWYCGQMKCMPVVIIIEDMERCCASVLSDFILMLSKWVVKLPVILVLGITTTPDALRNVLSANALLCLHTCKYVLRSPAQRMDAIVEAVLLKPSSSFYVSHKVALFVRDYFLKHDGTLTSFIKALKIACMQHFCSEPLSFLLKDLNAEDNFQELWKDKHAYTQDLVLKRSSELSCRNDKASEPTSEKLFHAIGELKKLHSHWATIVMCLHEAGKLLNVQLLDLYSEALDPDIHRSSTPDEDGKSTLRDRSILSQHGGLSKRSSIFNALHKVRDLPAAALSELLNSWARHTNDVSEICNKVKELQVLVQSEDSKSSGSNLENVSLRSCSRGTDVAKDPKVLNEKAVALIEWMIRDQMKPIESLAFHEILCFKKVDKLQTALLGDTRKSIQTDLLEFHKYLRCNCCSTRGSRLLPSLHDSSILYILSQEHGDIINVHDWFQSFKAILVNPCIASRKSKHSSTPKKKKDIQKIISYGEAELQARFCKAVSELQVTGLLRMPTKRRPDFVQRVAFGM